MSKKSGTDDIIDSIRELQNSIDKADKEIAVINDRINTVLENNKNKYGSEFIEELQEFIDKKEKELETLESKIQDKYHKLKKKKEELEEMEEAEDED